MDDYATPFEAVPVLVPYLKRDNIKTYVEPCAGAGDLVSHLNQFGFHCHFQGDLRYGFDALQMTREWLDHLGTDALVTNPPWTRALLHPLIDHFAKLRPTWLLFDADWCFTRQSSPLMPLCSDIVSVGRLKWMRDSPHVGKDNAAWYRFHIGHNGGTKFHGRTPA